MLDREAGGPLVTDTLAQTKSMRDNYMRRLYLDSSGSNSGAVGAQVERPDLPIPPWQSTRPASKL